VNAPHHLRLGVNIDHVATIRRHIRDDDLTVLMDKLTIPLNLEMAATDEMLAIALRHRPHAACIVPENREERTTEGGLDAAGMHNKLTDFVGQLREANIRVSLFIEPDPRQIEAAIRLGAPVVEFHTGHYAEVTGSEREAELRRIAAGQGLTFDNVVPIAAIPQLFELNIGHFLIGEAIFSGLDGSIGKMRELMDHAR
jgi:pyridoxine 5-phosphate synthase